jgi:threonine synthase
MKFISTRKQSPAVLFPEALERGLAPDGGLYVPEQFPELDLKGLNMSLSLPQLASRILRPFVEGTALEPDLFSICSSAFNFPIPLVSLDRQTAVLELFHGPTAAFKDIGARFLAECVSRTANPEGKKRSVLVATSGDTGGAVAGAFFNKPGIDVFILYPKGKVSARQEKQIACWGGNVHAFSVRGTFDDCQRIVKEVLKDASVKSSRVFISANSISIGRLLPQMIYYAKSSLQYRETCAVNPGLIIPTGNLGNAVAALWAKRLGFPIGKVVLATNANRAIGQYFQSGKWMPASTVATLANAMDVGNPSNMERLLSLYPDFAQLKKEVAVISVGDSEISEAIRKGSSDWGQTWCPHTATAVVAREKLGGQDWILVATAHPAKFETIVEPLIGHELEVPSALVGLLDRELQSTEIAASVSAFLTAQAATESAV